MLSIPHISRFQELIYELPTERVMNRDVVTISPGATMRELKEVLRVNRISGAPVVERGRMVGIVSLENLIQSLERGDTRSRVRDKMTTDVVTVRASQSVVEAVRKFAEHGVGRLPVVDDDGNLVGILTAGDITRGLLEVVGLSTQQQDAEGGGGPADFREIISDRTELTLWYRVQPRDFTHGGAASSKLKRVLRCLGAPPEIVRRAAIAAYEAEMNLVIHTDDGGEISAVIEPNLLHISARDNGPGIEDVEQVMRPGYSTAPHWIRELGFGAGMGLANIRRCADSMDLKSQPGVGTRLEIRFRLETSDSGGAPWQEAA